MQNVLDRCLCENMTLKDKLSQKITYSAMAGSSDTPSAQASICPDVKKKSQNLTHTQTVTINEGPSSKAASPSRSLSVLPIEQTGAELNDTDGFQKSTYELKKIRRRNAKAVVGKGQLDGTFKGAPNLPKSLFVYRVNKDTVTDVIRDYVSDQGITVLDIRCMSHEDSLSKSFKLTVSNEDYTKLFQEEMWPTGVRIRPFIPPRNQVKHNGAANK